MSRRILLDANLLIQALDGEGTSTESSKVEAKAQLKDLLADSSVVLAITPLIRYEVMRGVPLGEPSRFEKLEQALSGFDVFDISASEAKLAANLWRFLVSKNQKPDRKTLDLMHFASAETNQLEIASTDGDICRLKTQYAEMKKELPQHA